MSMFMNAIGPEKEVEHRDFAEVHRKVHAACDRHGKAVSFRLDYMMGTSATLRGHFTPEQRRLIDAHMHPRVVVIHQNPTTIMTGHFDDVAANITKAFSA